MTEILVLPLLATIHVSPSTMSHPPTDRDVLDAVQWCHRVNRMRNLTGDAVVTDAILLSAIAHEATTVCAYTSHTAASLQGGVLSVAVRESSGVSSVIDPSSSGPGNDLLLHQPAHTVLQPQQSHDLLQPSLQDILRLMQQGFDDHKRSTTLMQQQLDEQKQSTALMLQELRDQKQQLDGQKESTTLMLQELHDQKGATTRLQEGQDNLLQRLDQLEKRSEAHELNSRFRAQNRSNASSFNGSKQRIVVLVKEAPGAPVGFTSWGRVRHPVGGFQVLDNYLISLSIISY